MCEMALPFRSTAFWKVPRLRRTDPAGDLIPAAKPPD
jgi:hypothetical protein